MPTLLPVCGGRPHIWFLNNNEGTQKIDFYEHIVSLEFHKSFLVIKSYRYNCDAVLTVLHMDQILSHIQPQKLQ